MEKYIELNNLAVTCINEDKFKEAVHLLGSALHITKNQLSAPSSTPSSDQPCGEPSIPHNEAPQSQEIPCSHHQGVTIMTTSLVEKDDDERDPAIMDRQPIFTCSSEVKYQHPFTMFPEMNHSIQSLSGYSSPTTNRAIGISMVLIFNLALCFDLLASSSSSNMTRQKTFLAKASSLYEKVVELYLQCIFESIDDEITSTQVEDSEGGRFGSMILRAQQDVVVMAAINNLIQLNPESSSSSSSSQKEKYIHLIMALLQEIQRTDYGSDEIQSLATAQARVFVSNAVIVSSSVRLLSISAAAA